jgi:hypothetical protein
MVKGKRVMTVMHRPFRTRHDLCLGIAFLILITITQQPTQDYIRAMLHVNKSVLEPSSE